MSELNIIIYSTYAGLLFVGGIFGFIKGKSKASLIAGVVSCNLIIVGIFLLKDYQNFALALIAIVALALIGAFLKRFKITKKFMPSGMLLILSGAIFVYTCLELF